MELTLGLVCDEAQERPDGRFDVAGIFNELRAPGFPAVQARMTVVFVMQWEADDQGTQSFRADLLAAAGDRVLTIEGQTEVAARQSGRAPPQTRLVLPLENVVFPRPGRYHFEVVAGGDVHHACSLFVGESDPADGFVIQPPQ